MQAATLEQSFQSGQIAPPTATARELHLRRVFRLEALRATGSIRVFSEPIDSAHRRPSPAGHDQILSRLPAPD